jgi:hypothetical protein
LLSFSGHEGKSVQIEIDPVRVDPSVNAGQRQLVDPGPQEPALEL